MAKYTAIDILNHLESFKPSTGEEGIIFAQALQSALAGTLKGLNEAFNPGSMKLPSGVPSEGLDQDTPSQILTYWVAGSSWIMTPWSADTERMNFAKFFGTLQAVYWLKIAYGNSTNTPEDFVERASELCAFVAQTLGLLISSGNGLSTEQCDVLTEKLGLAIAESVGKTSVEFIKTTPFNPQWN
jgi:hypothetical protein